MFKIPKALVSIIMIALVCVVLFFVAVQVKACVQSNDELTGGIKTPNATRATHSFFIVNTGRSLLASDYDQYIDLQGDKVYILHGFWTVDGDRYVFTETDSPPLDEGDFGKIVVKKR